MKIIKIQKKSWWNILTGIRKWWAWVEHDGCVVKFSVWANDYTDGIPKVKSFLWDIKNTTAEYSWPNGPNVHKEAEEKILALQGHEILP